jgi:hypothetical protein
MRAKTYIIVLALAALFGYGANMRLTSIAACTADGYRGDTYLAYCDASRYGSFEHGALYLSLVPEAVRNLRAADVVMLGNSRTQRAFSTTSTEAFFRRIGASFYVAGFGYGENVNFAEALMDRLALRPRAVIVNVDPFFDLDISPPARTLLKTENGDDAYRDKDQWQDLHRAVCDEEFAKGWLCGDAPAIFRSVRDGRWKLENYPAPAAIPVSTVDEDRWTGVRERLAERAQAFVGRLERLGVPRSCVLFTVVPSDFATYGTARFLAERTGVPLFVSVPADLRTTDRSHLDLPSAERWSAELLDRMAVPLAGCVNRNRVAARP